MAGKMRPSLRPKTLENVKRSNLSQPDKKCIAAVFAEFDKIVRCKECKYWDTETIEKLPYSGNDGDYRPVDYAECTRWSDWATCYMLRYNDFCSCGVRRTVNDEPILWI